MHILVTGATGFVGSALYLALAESGQTPRVALRRQAQGGAAPASTAVVVGGIDGSTNWTEALRDIECAVHLAAPEAMPGAADPLAEYHRINVAGSRRLAEQAATAGVRRLVYMSTIKVNGEATRARPFTEDDAPQPQTDYGRSKQEAEQTLLGVGRETGLEVVILRPPLVYGPAVRGNFLRLMKLVVSGRPLPLASVHNRRSMVYIGNLVDAVLACIQVPHAAGRTYLVTDGTDVSTPDLVRALAGELGVAPRLFPFPPALLMLGASLLGKREEAVRVLGSLQVDSSRIRRELGWRPPHTVEEGLTQTARWFRETVNRKS